ncbi:MULTISPECIES: AraC family transcriptional regulator [unclassified Chitinophaga]|uniref:AraC family transcriptional regulator n=1 Tax=unclassified Chitinophaga TaxID=2619133 RepID=UPI0009C50ED2|nr:MULTISPECIES: AraC family transcriptional regulator [unclassified Chitinophaga]OMP75742.1 AraC family transcriptional regulator [[Flexibacter] sp. ATCC 35208]WPV70286.1 AraC family transcriptional regulator [Chitinophaga sp. LS1]
MNVLHTLAHLFGTTVKNRRLDIPEQFGKGYVTRFVFNEHIRMMIMNYELKENLVIENPEINASRSMILFKFQHIFDETEKQPSVLITTTSMNTDTVIPIHTNTSTINIEVDSNYLKSLFDLSAKSPVLEGLLQNTQPLLFEQMIYPSLQDIVNEIVSQSVAESFKMFFLRIKAEELVCRLLMELEKRDEKHLYALNSRDIATIYKIREEMLEHLDTPPVINDLALAANMSPTKLKSLFKQIFGNSIFSYYQECRMKKAALLLKEGNLSVSDVGYQLGFTNLSHFSRVFQEHIGMKPKQYSRT